jgi:hypothetical protein
MADRVKGRSWLRRRHEQHRIRTAVMGNLMKTRVYRVPTERAVM